MNLERGYRLLLRVLPSWYREDREEEMVGLFLAGAADRERGWPGWGEVGAVLSLAVRTRFAAGSAPGGTMWLGEVVRALGVLGLLLGMFYAGSWVTNAALLYNDPDFTSAVTWVRVFGVAPIVAFVALLSGRRTVAKIAALTAMVAVVPTAGQPGWLLWWALFQLPSVVTFGCLCLGFHREAPTPPADRLGWWGGGAVLLGVAGGLIGAAGVLLVVVAVVIVRVAVYRRGDFVLGRALSLFSVLLLAPVVPLLGLAGGGAFVVVAAALLVGSAAAPVRRASVQGSRLP